MPTQLEYILTKARQRGLYTRFELLNYNFQIVGNLEGAIINDPQFNNSATSSIRRTCSISLFPDDSSFDISSVNKIWLDKYIRVYIGIKDIHTGLVEYTNMGIYLVNNPSRVYDSQTNIITIEGLDLMAKMTGLRNSNLPAMDVNKNILISDTSSVLCNLSITTAGVVSIKPRATVTASTAISINETFILA